MIPFARPHFKNVSPNYIPASGYSRNMASSVFLFLFSVIPCILAVKVHPVARSVTSNATCLPEYQWMNNAMDDSPCLTVAYVEAACIGGTTYTQPALQVGYSYSLPNATTASTACYCSWSSYNLMMACTLCQGSNFTSSVWTWPAWSSGCAANPSWTTQYFPPGYELSMNISIPYWATLNRKANPFSECMIATNDFIAAVSWQSEVFNVAQANATYQQNPSNVYPSASSTSTSSGKSNPSSSGSSSKSTNVGAVVGGAVGGAAALALLAVGAYLVYRRHVYKKAYTSVVNPQGMGLIDRSNGATTSMTHNRFPSDTSTSFTPGYPLSPSQQYTMYSPQPQTVYPSLQGSFSPPPGTDISVYTTRPSQPSSNAIPLV